MSRSDLTNAPHGIEYIQDAYTLVKGFELRLLQAADIKSTYRCRYLVRAVIRSADGQIYRIIDLSLARQGDETAPDFIKRRTVFMGIREDAPIECTRPILIEFSRLRLKGLL